MIYKIKFVQPTIVDVVKPGVEYALLSRDYTSTAVGQVIAEDEGVVCIALVRTGWQSSEVICIPQRSILEIEVIDD